MRRSLDQAQADELLTNDGRMEPAPPDSCCAYLLAHPWPAWAREIALLPPGEALARLGSGWSGLDPGHAEAHLRSLGPNLEGARKDAGPGREGGGLGLGDVFVIRGRGVPGLGPRWVPAPLLAPGDLVLLAAGDTVPADVRILRAHEFHVEEGPLTGEGTPVRKTAECLEPLPGDPMAYPDLAFQGTRVVGGTATAVVVATGLHTVAALLRAS